MPVKKRRNPLRVDPTRTATLRRKMLTDIRRRYARFKALLLSDQALNSFCATGPGGGVDATCSPGVAGGGLLSRVKTAGQRIGAVEHAIKQWAADKVEENVAKLPPRTQKFVRGAMTAASVVSRVAFATYTAGQAMAERVAQERGATPEQAKRLRGILASADLAIAKPLALTAELSGVPGVGVMAAGFVPAASAGYL